MIELLFLYIGFTIGMCLMDYVSVRENYYLHMYKNSCFHILVSLLFAPITFPFYLIIYIERKVREHYL